MGLGWAGLVGWLWCGGDGGDDDGSGFHHQLGKLVELRRCTKGKKNGWDTVPAKQRAIKTFPFQFFFTSSP